VEKLLLIASMGIILGITGCDNSSNNKFDCTTSCADYSECNADQTACTLKMGRCNSSTDCADDGIKSFCNETTRTCEAPSATCTNGETRCNAEYTTFESCTDNAWIPTVCENGTTCSVNNNVASCTSNAPFDLRIHSSGQRGTPDPKFKVDNAFTYLGAFHVPWTSIENNDSRSTRDIKGIAYDPQTNSIYLGKKTPDHIRIFNFDIPELILSEDYTELNKATLRQPIFEKPEEELIWIDDGFRSRTMGFAKIIDGRLFLATYHDYSTGETPTDSLVIVHNPQDLANATWQGYLHYNNGVLGSKYAFPVPYEHQAIFNGRSWAMGAGSPPSIAGRWSFGNGLLAWSPETIAPTDTETESERILHYTQSNTVDGFASTNSALADYYGALITPQGMNFQEWLRLPIEERGVPDITKLPRPDPSLYKNIMNWEVTASMAFIPEGTDTVVMIGNLKGGEYGGYYKNSTLEIGEPHGTAGPNPISRRDRHAAMWLVNLYDIANQTETWETNPYDYLLFENDRWYTYDENSKNIRGEIVAGDYDPVTRRLYVLHGGIPHNRFNTSHVVAVYEVGGTD